MSVMDRDPSDETGAVRDQAQRGKRLRGRNLAVLAALLALAALFYGITVVRMGMGH